MKKYIILLLTIFILSATMNAQVDRSIQPKPGPAPKINLKEPQTFKLKNGLEVLLVENHKLPRVSVSLRLDNEPFMEGDKAGASSIAGSLLGSGTKKTSKDDFNEEMDFLGARVNFYDTGSYASSLSKYFPRVFELMADAALHPKFTQEEFDKIKNINLTGIKNEAKSVSAIAGRVRKAIGYGKNHPYGEFTSEKSLKNINLIDVENYYNTYYKPNNAYLVVVGDITLKEVKKLVKKNFKKWKKSDLPKIDFTRPTNVAQTEINFVNMPEAVQSEVKVVTIADLEMKDPDYHAVLVANQILGGDFNSYLNMNLREAHGYTYGARSSINADKYASMFRAGASVRNAVTDSTVMETIKELKRIRTELVDEETLKNVKAGYVGKFVLALERPQTIANYALNIKTNDLPNDFYKTYLEKINAVTVDDIKRVANKYFTVDKARVIVVGKALDVLPNLEKLGYKINYFDIEANPTKKPEMSKPVPNGVTLQTVVDAYIKAIGGKDKVNYVKSLKVNFQAEMQGQKLDMVTKSMAPNKQAMSMSMMGMTMMKQVFDGEKGYMERQGKKEITEGEDLENSKNKTAPFEIFGLLKGGELLGIEPIGDNEFYKVVKGKTTYFFDIKSGLKTKQISINKGPGGKEISQTVSFVDYKDYSGIKLPNMKISFGPQIIDFKIQDVKVNEDVSDKDFE